MKLYFIAIVLPEDLREETKSIKEEVKENYRAKHALKIPAHITLQPPLKLPESEEKRLISALEEFTLDQQPFDVELNGFGSFPPRVIYVKVVDHLPIVRLHNSLQKVMRTFTKNETGGKESPIHPHVTIASRDLTKDAYKTAWPEFREKQYKANFTAESFFLLKHNGKIWELHRELFFTKHDSSPAQN